MTVTRTDLSKLMYALADSGHGRATELRMRAGAFDTATHGFVSAQPQTHTVKQMVGAWARARRLYCECTGEALI